MDKGTKADYELVAESETENLSFQADRVLNWLVKMDVETVYGITRLEHGLQSATRAESDGADEETIVCTLLHDIGDELAPMNHSEYAASVLKPYVSEKTHWIIEKHGEFQTYYYAHHFGGDRNKRDKYKDHKYYQACVNFCEKYDQASFDPDYKSLPLSEFEPMVKRIFSRKPYSCSKD